MTAPGGPVDDASGRPGAEPIREPRQGAPAVLVLRALGLGDALTGVPALRGLRRAFPGRPLVLAAPEPVGRYLQRQGVVDDVLPTAGLVPLELPPGWAPGGHVAVNLHGRGPLSHSLLLATRPQRLVAFACPDAGHDDGPSWHADEHEVERWCRLVRGAGGECGPGDLLLRKSSTALRTGPVVLHPGAASGSRRWPADRWAAVARELTDRGHPVVVTGSRDERVLCADVAAGARGARNTAGALDLDGLTDLVAQARLVLCGDTGVAHLATACATPSVVLFGPTPPAEWGPAIDLVLHTVLWHGDPGDADRGDPHRPELDPLLARITVGEVLAAATALLEDAG